MAGRGVAERLGDAAWRSVEQDLDLQGYALLPRLLTRPECRALVELWDEDGRFRSRIDMGPRRFGEGEYRYFSRPLPALVTALRTQLYARLAPIANRWNAALGKTTRYPRTLRSYTESCHENGQLRPTPLLLHYTQDGYNCLHQDLYGELSFPFQVTGFLSRPEVDYGGGEFLLVEQRPRAQSRGEAIRAEQGDLLIFPNAHRPTQGKRGTLRVNLRHGVSRVRWGERWALGIIFHDAK